MGRFTYDELRQRAFERAAWVLRHFWEEQQDDEKREARVHTRIFDPLIHQGYINVGKSRKGGGHIEHLVPCVMLRDQAFQLFWKQRDAGRDIAEAEKAVAEMLGRFLRVAHISSEEAHHLDHVLGLKERMPDGWSFENGSVMARLVVANIELEFQ